MTTIATSHELKLSVQMNFEDALKRLHQSLKAGGFEIFSETNIRDFASYDLVRACRTFLVYDRELDRRAFTISPDSALLLPYRINVNQLGDALVEVEMLDPVAVFDLLGSQYLRPIAEELRLRLVRVIESLKD